MQRVDRKLLGLLVALAPLIGACSSDLSVANLNPKMPRPDWLSYSGNKQEFTLRQATAKDFVSPQGQCAPDPLVAGGDVGRGRRERGSAHPKVASRCR